MLYQIQTINAILARFNVGSEVKHFNLDCLHSECFGHHWSVSSSLRFNLSLINHCLVLCKYHSQTFMASEQKAHVQFLAVLHTPANIMISHGITRANCLGSWWFTIAKKCLKTEWSGKRMQNFPRSAHRSEWSQQKENTSVWPFRFLFVCGLTSIK